MIFHTAPRTHVKPPSDKRKVENIAVRCLFHTHQLRCRALAAHFRIKRQREHRHEEHVDAVIYCGFYKVFDNAPMRLTEHVHAVIGGKAVTVKPFGIHERLLGKNHVDDLKLQGLVCKRFTVGVIYRKRNRIKSGLSIFRNFRFDPKRSRAVFAERNAAVLTERQEQIGITSRFFTVQVIRVGDIRIARLGHINIFDLAHGNKIRKLGFK